jgi:putative ABC transport system permease protein
MEVRPILSALLRNRTGAILVGLQIALTLALVANALHIIDARIEKMNRPTGIDSANLVFLQSYGYSPSYDHHGTVLRDLDALQRIPGVVSAATIASLPLSGGGSANGYRAKNEERAPVIPGNYFEVSAGALQTLGLKLVAGRDFRREEITWAENSSTLPKQLIVTRVMAQKLFGTEAVVGRMIYDGGGAGGEIIGVVDHMFGSWVDNPDSTQVVFHPIYPPPPIARYAIRARPGQLAEVTKAAEKLLGAPGSGRFVTWTRPHAEVVEKAYRPDRRMISFLTTLIALMVGVTALGIVGLATFHVNARRKQIGTRRAVGARRIDIVRYFLVENGLLAAAGVVVGAALAYGFSWWLTTAFQLTPLRPGFVLVTALGLVVVGQLAVLWPARRAAAIPPAVATRTV